MSADIAGLRPNTAERRRRLGRVVGFAVVLGLLLVGAWWWTHPSLLRDSSPLGNISVPPRPIDEATIHVNVAAPPVKGDHSETITLHSAKAHFATNTAGVEPRFSVCVGKPGADSVLGAVSDSLDNYCSEVRPIEDGTTIDWTAGDPRAEYIVMTLKATKEGVATVDEVTFEYSRSWRNLGQRGSDRSTQHWTLRATE